RPEAVPATAARTLPVQRARVIAALDATVAVPFPMDLLQQHPRQLADGERLAGMSYRFEIPGQGDQPWGPCLGVQVPVYAFVPGAAAGGRTAQGGSGNHVRGILTLACGLPHGLVELIRPARR